MASGSILGSEISLMALLREALNPSAVFLEERGSEGRAEGMVVPPSTVRVKEWERGRERERVIRVARETDRRRHGLP